LKKLFLSTLTLLSISVLLISWGSTGHKKISEASVLSFNQQMQDFNSWTAYLRDHATDPDTRKGSDPTESPKHYIDIDNYNDFITKGRILQTFDSANNYYSSAIVLDNGILPWATKASFDSMRNCMQRHDFVKAKFFAADLGHYVADGHMPLHITKNYDGQLTGNTGIHSRYESAMIDANISQIVYTGENATEISDVNQYIFNYLYKNNSYCDSVLQADNYAKLQSGGSTSTTAYKTALWSKTKSFTIPLFQRASHALASLIFTAWLQAGSPSLTITGTNDPLASNASLDQNMPNPFSSTSRINYSLKENTKVLMEVRDINGKIVSTLVNDNLLKGNHSFDWTPENLPAGLYYLVLHTGNFVQVKKMVYSGKN
jgi:hypothetical protein